MIVYLNGELVPEDQAKVSVFDRAFLYGDSLFETMRVHRHRVFRWHQHMERFLRGVDELQFRCPTSPPELEEAARRLIERNQFTDGLLRLTLSRGVGSRGYSPRGAESPTLVMTLHPGPDLNAAHPPEWRIVTSTLRVGAADRLAACKSGSKLRHVVARMEADRVGADEALLVNAHGEVLEGTAANLFWTRGDVVYTSPTAAGALPGITRAVVLEICAARNLAVKKLLTKLEQVMAADALFMTNTAHGIVAVASLDNQTFPGHPLVAQLQALYAEVVSKECGSPAAPSPNGTAASPAQ